MRFSYTLVALSLLLAVTHMDAQASEARKPYSTTDSWYRPAANTALMQSKYAIPQQHVFAVPKSHERRLLSVLKNRPWRKLTAEEARSLGIPGGERPKDGFYVVRALVLNEATGAFQVFEHDGVVLVHHSSLGRKPVPMRRKAIVVALPQEPHDLYVSCGMSE